MRATGWQSGHVQVGVDINDPYWPWRNRKGEPISTEEACRLFSEEGNSLRTVGKARLGPLLISTVHIVAGHPCWGHDPENCQAQDEPLGCMAAIYETMVFCEDEDAPGRFQEWDHRQWRYHTLKGAIAGHQRIVAEVASLVA